MPPRKAPDGLGHVLFVRVDQALLDKLNALTDRLRAERRHPGLSRSDVVRELIHKEFERQGLTAPRGEDT